MAGVVIVGTGTAGAQVAMALRQKGYEGPVALIGDEVHPPYQRPPLSKAFLAGGEADTLHLRPEAFWADKGIELRAGVRVAAIEREERAVRLADGTRLAYDHLVLATGARNRSLPGAEGALDLRTIDDAHSLRERLVAGAWVVVVGGGFIGLEVAASARALGAEVVVVEAAERVMARVVSPEMSAFFHAEHERCGARILTGALVERVREGAVTLADGETLAADVVLVGVGVTPDVELAEAAGLVVDDGIEVDERLLTVDPAISAVGDCARFPCGVSGVRHRLESIQNATDQARCVASRLVGEDGAYSAVPWFWSDQHAHKLQIAGVAPAGARSVLRGDPASGAFSVCRFSGDRLVAVESVNALADHMAARKLLARDAPAVRPEQVIDVGTPLKALVTAAA